MQFSPAPGPARSVRGWRRWTPIVLPTAVLAVSLVLCAVHLLLLRDGLTYGLQLVLKRSLLHAAGAGALTAATYGAIRNGDRDPAWRRVAWALAGLTAVIVATGAA